MAKKEKPGKPAGRKAGYRLTDLWEKAREKPKTIGEAMAEVLRHPHPVTHEMAERVKRKAPLNVDQNEVERAAKKRGKPLP